MKTSQIEQAMTEQSTADLKRWQARLVGSTGLESYRLAAFIAGELLLRARKSI